jgi:hypothetical protein
MIQSPLVRLLVAVAVVISTSAGQPAAQSLTGLRPSWSDLETWSRKGMDIRETDVGVGLHLSGVGGTMLLSFSATLNSRSPSSAPSEVAVMAGAPLDSNPNTVRTAVLGFVVEIEDVVKKTSERKTIDLTSKLILDNPAPGARVENGIAKMTIAQFTDMVKAKTASARIFGADVVFRADQLKAVAAFGERIHVRPRP